MKTSDPTIVQANANSVTSLGATLANVEVDTFTNWRWQMKHQVATQNEASRYLSLQEDEKQGFRSLGDLFNIGVTPYYMALIASLDDQKNTSGALRLQALPTSLELDDNLGKKDPLLEQDHSPVKEVVHVYPDRVAFCVAQLCPVYCRYCFRKRRDEESGLHFNRNIVDRGVSYIASNKHIKDVLVTGGDPFIASDATLRNLLEKLRQIPHVEIIRFGTRTPVTLPYRITDDLVDMLKQFHPIWLNTHFNCEEEITPEAQVALAKLANAGIPLGNQAVLLKGINDSTEKQMRLCRALLKNRVRPYYLFHPHTIEGTSHLRVPITTGLKIMNGLRGNLTGFGIPTYALDTPSGKIPLGHNHILGKDNQDLILEDIRGEIWREGNVF